MIEVCFEKRNYAKIRKEILAGLISYNDEFVSKPLEPLPLLISLREDQNIVGGVVANTLKDWCFVEILWINKENRRKGFGTIIMGKVEEEAKRRSVKHIYLDTFSFQAPDFYNRLGYKEFGRLENFPYPYTRYWLAKDLTLM